MNIGAEVQHEIDLRTRSERQAGPSAQHTHGGPEAEVAVFAADEGAGRAAVNEAAPGADNGGADALGAIAVLGHRALSTLGSAGVAVEQARTFAAQTGDSDILTACDEAGRLLDVTAEVIRQGVVLQHGWTSDDTRALTG